MFGAWSLTHLPIDAVPDITNNQVQINARAPALSAFEIEKQVTFPIENLLAGISQDLNIRARSRAMASHKSPQFLAIATIFISHDSKLLNG